MAIELKGMSRNELVTLRARVEKQLETLAEDKRKDALAAAQKAAMAHGFTLDEVVGRATAKGKAKSKAKPRYFNPADKSQTWTGKGRQPAWFKHAIASGADPSSFEI